MSTPSIYFEVGDQRLPQVGLILYQNDPNQPIVIPSANNQDHNATIPWVSQVETSTGLFVLDNNGHPICQHPGLYAFTTFVRLVPAANIVIAFPEISMTLNAPGDAWDGQVAAISYYSQENMQPGTAAGAIYTTATLSYTGYMKTGDFMEVNISNQDGTDMHTLTIPAAQAKLFITRVG